MRSAIGFAWNYSEESDEHVTQLRDLNRSYSAVIGAQSSKKTKVPAPAKGQRDGDVWICAENDTFNRIIVSLGQWDNCVVLTLCVIER